MNERLVDRRIVVRIGGLEISTGGPGGLDVDFDITKRLDSKPNICSLSIYNLSTDHRAKISSEAAKAKQHPVAVEVLAGYKNPGPSRIFRGDLRMAEQDYEGSNWITKVEAGDGEFSVSRAKIFKSWKAGTSVATVLRDIVSALGLGQGNLAQATIAKFLGGGDAFVGGTAASGKAMRELSRITKSLGLSWSIQDGVLTFLADGKSLEGTAILLTPNTGMVGSPKPWKKSAKNGVDVRTLMIPDVFPGRKLSVQSKIITGFYVAQRVQYSGSNFGEDFYCDISATELV